MPSTDNSGHSVGGVSITTIGWVAFGSAVLGIAAQQAIRKWRRAGKDKYERDLIGLTAVVTGSNTGIGFATAQGLSARGATVILACRDVAACQKAVEAIKDTTDNTNVQAGPRLDLSDIHSIIGFAKEMRSQDIAINVLINNAGAIIGDYQTSNRIGVDGRPVELTFATNCLGPLALSLELLPNLRAAASKTRRSRIVNVGSKLEKFANLDKFLDDPSGKSGLGLQSEGSRDSAQYNHWTAYANSKLGNTLATFRMAAEMELDKELITVNAVTPGVANSSLGKFHPWYYYTATFRWLLMPTCETAAYVPIAAATSPTLEGLNGNYFCRDSGGGIGGSGVKAKTPTEAAHDLELMAKFWNFAMGVLGQEWRAPISKST